MEASVAAAPVTVGRLSLAGPLLRLRSDDQLVTLFRAGSEEAFTVIHDRYRQRLFAYVRQMLSSASRQDAEDVMQDVFMRAYGALRSDRREVHLRAWLYRVAHNRCIDYVRRPAPPVAEIFETSRTPLQDPIDTAQRRDDLRRLVQDVGALPDQQRSALLMREIDGMPYADIAGALGVTVPAVKSLLVRARVGLAEAAEARETDCSIIREDLAGSYDRGVKASGRARRHMKECEGCREFRTSLRGMRRSFAALSPISAAGPLALAAKALGIGGASAGGGAAVGGGAVAGGSIATATACKVAAVVCTAAITAGGAVEVRRAVQDGAGGAGPSRFATAPASATGAAAAGDPAGAAAPTPVGVEVIRHRTEPAAPVRREKEPKAKPPEGPASVSPVVTDPPATPVTGPLPVDTGGIAAPATGGTDALPGRPAGERPAGDGGAQQQPTGSGSQPSQPAAGPAAQPGTGESGGTAPDDGAPPGEH